MKIRQEINILNQVLSAAGGSSATSNQIVNLDTTMYPGATYYFEIVGDSTLSISFNVTLRRFGTSTDDATCNIPLLTTAYTLVRSASFTPPAGAGSTDYVVFIDATVGATKNVKAARIIILQDEAFRTSGTCTCIDLGLPLSTISTTNVTLGAGGTNRGKYWKYTSANWTSGFTVVFDVVIACASSKSVTTATLQVADGSGDGFINFTDVTNASLTTIATTPTRVRSTGTITLTAGRNYRVVVKSGTSKSAANIYSALLLLQYYSLPTLVGSGLTISGIFLPALCALSSTRVAFIDSTLDSLRTYDFDGSNWALVGSGLSITSAGSPALCALSSTRVAFIDATNSALRTYDFDGSNWALVGSGLTISGIGSPALATLSSTRVAFIDATNDSLRTYDFNGSTWSLVGSGLTISGIVNPALCALSSTRVVLINQNTFIRTYDFDGSSWSQVGNSTAITNTSFPAIVTLSTTRVALLGGTATSLRTYDFDGSNWAQVGSGLNLQGSQPALAALSSTRVTFIDDQIESLRAYDINLSFPSAIEPQYELMNAPADAGTALQVTLTKWDSTEWYGVNNTYTFAVDAINGATDVVEADTAAGTQIVGSVVTSPDNQGISIAMTMPADGNLDCKLTTNNTDTFSTRILVKVTPWRLEALWNSPSQNPVIAEPKAPFWQDSNVFIAIPIVSVNATVSESSPRQIPSTLATARFPERSLALDVPYTVQPHPSDNVAVWDQSPKQIPSTLASIRYPERSLSLDFPFTIEPNPILDTAVYERVFTPQPQYPKITLPERTFALDYPFPLEPHPVLNVATWEQNKLSVLPLPPNTFRQKMDMDYAFAIEPNPMLNISVWEQQIIAYPLKGGHTSPERAIDLELPFYIEPHPMLNSAVWEMIDERPSRTIARNPVSIDEVFIPVVVAPQTTWLTLDSRQQVAPQAHVQFDQGHIFLEANPILNVALWEGSYRLPVKPVSAPSVPDTTFVQTYEAFQAAWLVPDKPGTSLKTRPEFNYGVDYPFLIEPHPTSDVAVWEQNKGAVPPVYPKATPERMYDGNYAFVIEPHPVLNVSTWESTPGLPEKPKLPATNLDGYVYLEANPILDSAIYGQDKINVVPTYPRYFERIDMEFPFRTMENPQLDPAVWEQQRVAYPLTWTKNTPERSTALDYPYQIEPHVMLNGSLWEQVQPSKVKAASVIRLEEYIFLEANPILNAAIWEQEKRDIIPTYPKPTPEKRYDGNYPFPIEPHSVLNPSTWEQVVRDVAPRMPDDVIRVSLDYPYPMMYIPPTTINPALHEQNRSFILPPFAKNYPERTTALDFPFSIEPHPMLNSSVWEQQKLNVLPPSRKSYPERSGALDYPFAIEPHVILNHASWEEKEARLASVEKHGHIFLHEYPVIALVANTAYLSESTVKPTVHTTPSIVRVIDQYQLTAVNPSLNPAAWSSLEYPRHIARPKRIEIPEDKFIKLPLPVQQWLYESSSKVQDSKKQTGITPVMAFPFETIQEFLDVATWYQPDRIVSSIGIPSHPFEHDSFYPPVIPLEFQKWLEGMPRPPHRESERWQIGVLNTLDYTHSGIRVGALLAKLTLSEFVLTMVMLSEIVATSISLTEKIVTVEAATDTVATSTELAEQLVTTIELTEQILE